MLRALIGGHPRRITGSSVKMKALSNGNVLRASAITACFTTRTYVHLLVIVNTLGHKLCSQLSLSPHHGHLLQRRVLPLHPPFDFAQDRRRRGQPPELDNPRGRDKLSVRCSQSPDQRQRPGLHLGRQRQPFDGLRTGLLNDGPRSYSYDHANRLTQVVSGTLTTQFTYNGAGDRVAKTVDGVETRYTLDPAAGLTQVLQETTAGQTTGYLYGHDLLAQYDSGTWAYHVNDGLGSVRQLADPTGQVVGSYSFSPFGVPLGESGGEPYGYTGEQWDASAGLVFLRARYYQPAAGRFLSKDPFPGFDTSPQTLNSYSYVENNAVNRTDPTGEITREEAPDAEKIIDELRESYGIYVEKDFFQLGDECAYPAPPPLSVWPDPRWYAGAWEYSELDTVKKGVEKLAGEFLSPAEFRRIVGGAMIDRYRGKGHWKQLASRQLWKEEPWAFTASRSVTIFATPDEALIAHELGHVWDGVPPRITPLIKAFKGNELPWDLGMERGWEYWPATVEAWVYERENRFNSRPRHREFARAAFLGIYLRPEDVPRRLAH